MSTSSSVRAIAIRVSLVGLFLVGYATVWRPARDWLSGHVVAPILAQVETPRSQQYIIQGEPARAVDINRADQTAPVATFTTPGGALFVVSGTLLVLLAPWQLYWLYLGLYQLLLGAVMLCMLAIGIGWAEWGFMVFDLLETTLYPGTSLAAPLVAYGLQIHPQNRVSDGSPSGEPPKPS